jgi:hypothetical protein
MQNKRKKVMELLKDLPSAEQEDRYCGWQAGDECMTPCKKGGEDGSYWDESLTYPTWEAFRENHSSGNRLNVVVDFYFEAYTENCPDCSLGYTPEAQELYDTFYDDWQHALTQDEVDALLTEGRLFNVKEEDEVTPENYREYLGRFGHDATNKSILIKVRTNRLGIKRTCPTCDGHASVCPTDKFVTLNIWLTHPRKGASRGIHIKKVPVRKLDEVREFLRGDAEILRKRFAWAEGTA